MLPPPCGRNWYFIAEQPAPAHQEGGAALRIVLVTVPRVRCVPPPPSPPLPPPVSPPPLSPPPDASLSTPCGVGGFVGGGWERARERESEATKHSHLVLHTVGYRGGWSRRTGDPMSCAETAVAAPRLTAFSLRQPSVSSSLHGSADHSGPIQTILNPCRPLHLPKRSSMTIFENSSRARPCKLGLSPPVSPPPLSPSLPPPCGRNWYVIAEQPAPAPHLAYLEGCAALRIVLGTVPRVRCVPPPPSPPLPPPVSPPPLSPPPDASLSPP